MTSRIFGLLTGFVFTILVAGCIVIDLDGSNKQLVRGSGNIITEKRHVSKFNEVNLKGSGNIYLTRGAEQSLAIKTDDNVMPYLETYVRNEKLIISHEEVNLRPTTLNIYITVQNLRGISIAGSGDVYGRSRFTADNLYAEIKGSGDINLELEVDSVDSGISGSGSIHLSGQTRYLNASIKGSGNINAFELNAKNVEVSIKGSGECKVIATDSLKTEIKGSGDVFYRGHPQIDSVIKGSGSVRNRN